MVSGVWGGKTSVAAIQGGKMNVLNKQTNFLHSRNSKLLSQIKVNSINDFL